MSSKTIYTSETALRDLIYDELREAGMDNANVRTGIVERIMAQVGRLGDQPDVVQQRLSDLDAPPKGAPLTPILEADRGQPDNVVQAQLQYLEAKLGYEVGILSGAINSLAEKVLRLEQRES